MFSVNTIACSFKTTNCNNKEYRLMANNTEFVLRLSNNGDTPCDVEVYISDKFQGEWRIGAKKEIFIERPEHDNKIFTFNGSSIIDPKNEYISVLFKPARSDILHERTYNITSQIKHNFYLDEKIIYDDENLYQKYHKIKKLSNEEIDWDRSEKISINIVECTF